MINLKRYHLKKFISFFETNKRMFATEIGGVEFDTKNNCGIITLNRTKTLNAIDLVMVQNILEKLQVWENSRSLIIIKGIGRAFCAGGDIKGAIVGGPGNTSEGKKFFRTEYSMNFKIGTLKIPYIALIDGITMGGGVGLSIHGTYRVATERTLFSMPETAIGLFPDVGASYFLSRLPNQMGLYLALTGHRLIGAECVRMGFATHYVHSSNIENIFNELIDTRGDVKKIEETLKKYSLDHNSIPFNLESKRSLIDKIFNKPTIEEIFSELKHESSQWSLDTLSTLSKMSPTSLKITKQELFLGKTMSLLECLQMENRLAAAVLEGRVSKDFYEGVRAMLVDKDKSPKWNPSKLEDITEDMIQSCFASLKVEDELSV